MEGLKNSGIKAIMIHGNHSKPFCGYNHAMKTGTTPRLLSSMLVLLAFFVVIRGDAALYCVMDFGGKRCQFTDLASCQKAAGTQGNCFLNQEGMQVPTGGSPFCLVESWHTDCIYRDLDSCTLVASPRHATCIANPNLTAHSPVDAEISAEPVPKNTDYLPSPAYQPQPGYR